MYNFHFAGKTDNLFPYSKFEVDHIFLTVTILLFGSGVCGLPSNNRNALNLKRNHKANREKSKLSVNKFQDFFLKKNSKTYIRVFTTFITLNRTRNRQTPNRIGIRVSERKKTEKKH